MLHLHNLKSATHQRKKRVGRGNASGHGTYSTRGMKGQRSRAGGRRKAQARPQFLRQLPKMRGFKSKKSKNQILNVGDLNQRFKDGSIVSPKTLREKGLIDNMKRAVKILGQGELKIKNLKIKGCQLSQSAQKKIKSA